MSCSGIARKLGAEIRDLHPKIKIHMVLGYSCSMAWTRLLCEAHLTGLEFF
jgi:hypothetical protein